MGGIVHPVTHVPDPDTGVLVRKLSQLTTLSFLSLPVRRRSSFLTGEGMGKESNRPTAINPGPL